MKWILQVYLLLIIVVGGLYILGRQVPCKQILTYRIGVVDSRFSLTQEQIQAAVEKAVMPWEKLAQRQLFEWDQAHGDIAINFIYDERQERTEELNKLDNEEANLNTKQSEIDATYAVLEKEYDQKSASYETEIKIYEKDLESYNKEVSRLNKSGEVTESDVKRINKESERLEKESVLLEQRRLVVNTLANRLNKLAKNEQEVVEGFNAKVDQFQDHYGEEGVFDQGDYGGKDLNIYQFRDQDDLAVVLSHELGHSLGLGHVENPRSIMYYLMGEQPSTPVLSAEDKEAFADICDKRNGVSWENLTEILTFVKDKLQSQKAFLYE
jgi:Matrixin